MVKLLLKDILVEMELGRGGCRVKNEVHFFLFFWAVNCGEKATNTLNNNKEPLDLTQNTVAACVNPSKSSVFIPLYITCFCTQTHHDISTPTSHLIFMFYSFWLGWNLTVKAPPVPNSTHFLRTFKYFYAHATQGGVHTISVQACEECELWESYVNPGS